MSHRAEDHYGFVATRTIMCGNVAGFREGDPVPDSTVEEMGLLDSGDVVRRDEWQGRPADEPARALKRGEMPPHLAAKVAADGAADESDKRTAIKTRTTSKSAS